MTTTDKLSSAKLNWTTWFFIVTIIMATGWAASQGATVFLDVSLEYRISDLENLTIEMQRLTIEQALNSSFYPMQKAYSYMVSKVGSYTTKQNGTTAKLEWWSTDSSVIVDACVGNLTDGSIFFKNAIYDLSSLSTYIDTTDKNLVFIGEDWESTVFLDSRTGATRTISSTNTNGNLTVRNIRFDRSVPSDLTQKYSIYGSWNSLTVEHCKFIGNLVIADHDTQHYLSMAVGGTYDTDTITEVYFKNNYILNFQYGLNAPNSVYVFCDGNYVENAQTEGLIVNVPVNNGTYIMQNNMLMNCAWFDEGIGVDNHNGASVVYTNTLIADNIIQNDETKASGSAIVSTRCSGVDIIGNKILDYGNYTGSKGRITIYHTGNDLSDIVVKDNTIIE